MKLIAAILVCFLVIFHQANSNKVFLDFKSIVDHVNGLKTTWTAGHNSYFDGMDLQ